MRFMRSVFKTENGNCKSTAKLLVKAKVVINWWHIVNIYLFEFVRNNNLSKTVPVKF